MSFEKAALTGAPRKGRYDIVYMPGYRRAVIRRNRNLWENVWLKAVARNTFHSKSEMKRIKVQREKVS